MTIERGEWTRTLGGGWRPLFVWILATLTITLAGPRLAEWLPSVALGVLIVLFYGAWPLALAGWSLWRRHWLAALGVVLAGVGLTYGMFGVALAGCYLNFLAHKPAYDRIVDDAKAGNLSGRATVYGLRGRRSGVEFIVEAPSAVTFPWSHDQGSFLGITYDEAKCPRPPPKPPVKGMKHAGALGTSLRLNGHYCLVTFVS